MSTIATVFAFIGGAIFLILFVWKSRDFYKEAWRNAEANQFPPRKCLFIAIAYTALLWLLILGSFVVFGMATIKADSLLAGLVVMAVWVVALILLIMKLSSAMPIKAKGPEDDVPS